MARYQTETLARWLRNPGADQYQPITAHAPRIGIHDVPAIAHVRTYLWDLADYYVQSVQAGVIWLAPKSKEQRKADREFVKAFTENKYGELA